MPLPRRQGAVVKERALVLPSGRVAVNDGRWGFGSFNQETGAIILSRRLLMMSEAVIDFLIAHELAHAEYHEHGAEHDALVREILPDFDELGKEFEETSNRS